MTHAFSFRPPLRLVGILALVSSLVVGCDASKTPSGASSKSTAYAQSATQVCNGALDAATASYLKEVSGAQDFSSKVYEKREDIAASMKRELPLLSDGFGNEHYACNIFWHNTGIAQSPIVIYTYWATKPLTPIWTSPKDATAYDVADGAWSSESGAYIYFRCPIKGKEQQQMNSHTRIRAYLLIHDSPNKRQIREAMLNILHTFSVELAQSLGCLNTGNLPKQLGKVKGYPVKAG